MSFKDDLKISYQDVHAQLATLSAKLCRYEKQRSSLLSSKENAIDNFNLLVMVASREIAELKMLIELLCKKYDIKDANVDEIKKGITFTDSICLTIDPTSSLTPSAILAFLNRENSSSKITKSEVQKEKTPSSSSSSSDSSSSDESDSSSTSHVSTPKVPPPSELPRRKSENNGLLPTVKPVAASATHKSSERLSSNQHSQPQSRKISSQPLSQRDGSPHMPPRKISSSSRTNNTDRLPSKETNRSLRDELTRNVNCSVRQSREHRSMREANYDRRGRKLDNAEMKQYDRYFEEQDREASRNSRKNPKEISSSNSNDKKEDATLFTQRMRKRSHSSKPNEIAPAGNQLSCKSPRMQPEITEKPAVQEKEDLSLVCDVLQTLQRQRKSDPNANAHDFDYLEESAAQQTETQQQPQQLLEEEVIIDHGVDLEIEINDLQEEPPMEKVSRPPHTPESQSPPHQELKNGDLEEGEALSDEEECINTLLTSDMNAGNSFCDEEEDAYRKRSSLLASGKNSQISSRKMSREESQTTSKLPLGRIPKKKPGVDQESGEEDQPGGGNNKKRTFNSKNSFTRSAAPSRCSSGDSSVKSLRRNHHARQPDYGGGSGGFSDMRRGHQEDNNYSPGRDHSPRDNSPPIKRRDRRISSRDNSLDDAGDRYSSRASRSPNAARRWPMKSRLGPRSPPSSNNSRQAMTSHSGSGGGGPDFSKRRFNR